VSISPDPKELPSEDIDSRPRPLRFRLCQTRAGLIGIEGTNALLTRASWGGLDKIVGINPCQSRSRAGRKGRSCSVSPVARRCTASFGSPLKGAAIPRDAPSTEGNEKTDAAAALEGLIQPIDEQRSPSARAGASFEDYAQHEAIFNAIERRDPVAAETAMGRHFDRSRVTTGRSSLASPPSVRVKIGPRLRAATGSSLAG
jgi:hypothetical protein